MKHMLWSIWITIKTEFGLHLVKTEGSSLYNSEEVWENYDDYFKKYPLVYKQVMKGAGPFTLDGRDEADMKKLLQ
jgi:hypothetical protein